MPEIDLKLLGYCIRNARKDLNLTQKELADQTGLSVKTVHDIEKGCKNPTYETLVRLMNRLGLSPETVFSSKPPAMSAEIQSLLRSFQSSDLKSQKIL